MDIQCLVLFDVYQNKQDNIVIVLFLTVIN
jgi:hypothetical protein